MKFEQVQDQLEKLLSAIDHAENELVHGPNNSAFVRKHLGHVRDEQHRLAEMVIELRAEVDDGLENQVVGPVDVEIYCGNNPEALDDIAVPDDIVTELWRSRLISASEHPTVGELFDMLRLP